MANKTTQHYDLWKLLTENQDSKGNNLSVSITHICNKLGEKRGKGPLKATSIPVYIHELKELHHAVIESISDPPGRKRTHFRLANEISVPMYRSNAKMEIVSTEPVNTQVPATVKVDTKGKNPTKKVADEQTHAGKKTTPGASKAAASKGAGKRTEERSGRGGKKTAAKPAAGSKDKTSKAKRPSISKSPTEASAGQRHSAVEVSDEDKIGGHLDVADDVEVGDIKDSLGVSLETEY